jgi:hypothetical protein
MKQLGNFNKRIVTIEEGFFKTAKMIMWFEQAKDYLNQYLLTTLPTPLTVPSQSFQIQQNLLNEFLNIESKHNYISIFVLFTKLF